MEPQPTPQRAARCRELPAPPAERGLPADDPLARERQICRSALRAANTLIHTAHRTTQHVEEGHVRTGVLAARRIVDAFNRDGAEATFDAGDTAFVEAYLVALEAERCLTATTPPRREADASRSALAAFNRSGGAVAYGAAGRQAIRDCLTKPRPQRRSVAVAPRVTTSFVPAAGRVSSLGARFRLPEGCTSESCPPGFKTAPAGQSVAGRSVGLDAAIPSDIRCTDVGFRFSMSHTAAASASIARTFEPYGPGAQGTKPLKGALMYWGESLDGEVYCVIVTYPAGPDRTIVNHQFCTHAPAPEEARQRLHAIAETYEPAPLSAPREPVCLPEP
jgi:hypothetical protein